MQGQPMAQYKAHKLIGKLTLHSEIGNCLTKVPIVALSLLILLHAEAGSLTEPFQAPRQSLLLKVQPICLCICLDIVICDSPQEGSLQLCWLWS